MVLIWPVFLPFFAMVIVNFEIVMQASGNGPQWLVLLTEFFHGKAAASFVVLAGVGLSLMNKNSPATGIILKRSIFLFVIGLALIPLWPADILHYYGVFLALSLIFLARSTWVLISAIISINVIYLMMLVILDYEAGWDFETLEYLEFWQPFGFLRNLFFNGFHPVLPWFSFILYGIWLGRQNISQPETAKRLFFIAITLIVTAMLMQYFLTALLSQWQVSNEEINALLSSAPMPPNPIYILTGLGSATLLILLCQFISTRMPNLVKPLQATGRMALTHYVSHVILGVLPLYLLGSHSLLIAVFTAILFMLFSIVFFYPMAAHI